MGRQSGIWPVGEWRRCWKEVGSHTSSTPYLGDPDAMCVRLAIETYEVPDGVRSTFMDRRIIDDMRMTDRVGGDLVIFIVPGDGVSVSIQANPVRISAERQKELLDQLVDILCC